MTLGSLMSLLTSLIRLNAGVMKLVWYMHINCFSCGPSFEYHTVAQALRWSAKGKKRKKELKVLILSSLLLVLMMFISPQTSKLKTFLS